MRMIRRSLTLVPVGPVTNRSPRAANQAPAVVRLERRLAARRAARRRRRRRPPRCRRRSRRCRRRARECPARPASASAAASAYSWLGPPRPAPRTVTVSSPPEIEGGARRGAARASAACSRPTSRASPSHSSSADLVAEPPRLRRRRLERVGGAGDDAPVARHLSRASRTSPAPARRCRSGRGSRARRRRSSDRPTVGPEPISSGESPTTSEMARVTSRAGAAARASRPPLNRERWRRTQLISLDRRSGAEQGRGERLLLRQVQPLAGQAGESEAPPLSRTRTRSSCPGLAGQREQPLRRRDAGLVGHRMAGVDRARSAASAPPLPCGVTASPDSGPGQRASTHRAIGTAALPSASTDRAARRRLGRCGGSTRSGRQASIPARQIASRCSRRHGSLAWRSRSRLLSRRLVLARPRETAPCCSHAPLRIACAAPCSRIPLLYFLAALILGAVPANRGWREAKEGVTIFVRTNGVHTWILVPKVTPEMDWRPLVPGGASQGHALGPRQLRRSRLRQPHLLSRDPDLGRPHHEERLPRRLRQRAEA